MITVKSTRAFSENLLQAARQQMDAPADALIAQLYTTAGAQGIAELMQWVGNPKDSKIPTWGASFFEQQQALPTWANWQQMQQGIDLFRANRPEIALLLGCLSLPYCYAAADGAQVLYLSQRLHQDAFKRLQETGAFVFNVTNPLAWKSGEAIRNILKVRLMHAAIRHYCLQSGRWNNTWGQPINQEDMAGTNLAFSYLIIKGLRKINQAPDDHQAEAYLHLWNVIGCLMGVQESLRPLNLREAFILDKAIAQRQFKPSEAGKTLTKSLLAAFESLIQPAFLSQVPAAQMRWLLGDQVADLLDIPSVEIEKKLVRFLPIRLIFG
ncbi:MAG: oxygenase MpaB family protein [Spirosomataceae bacterium]